MRVYIIADTHFNHANIATYCDRPSNFTDLIVRRWQTTVKADDMVIHLGDVFIGKSEGWDAIHPLLPGKKTLIRGNHDDQRSPTWWLAHGFDSVCDGMMFRGQWLTHHPWPSALPDGCQLNIHGHLHNIWNGFMCDALVGPRAEFLRRNLERPWQRLFAVEYTDYRPVEFDKFIAKPDKYQARGPRDSVKNKENT